MRVTDGIKKWKVSHEIKNVSSQNAFHTALAEAKQLAVNNSVSYFSAWAGSQPFQSQLKGCLQNTGISSASRHESKVPRGGGGSSLTQERLGVLPNLWQLWGIQILNAGGSHIVYQKTALCKALPYILLFKLPDISSTKSFTFSFGRTF